VKLLGSHWAAGLLTFGSDEPSADSLFLSHITFDPVEYVERHNGNEYVGGEDTKPPEAEAFAEAFVFHSSIETVDECLKYSLFGMKEAQRQKMEDCIGPDTKLLLLTYSKRKKAPVMRGVFYKNGSPGTHDENAFGGV
jgi:hypothetical protein